MVITHFLPFPRGNFNSSYLLYKLTKWPQFGLILKNRHSSLKWAQVEICSFISLGATVFQSWYYFQKNDENPYNFARSYLLNEFSYRSQIVIFISNAEYNIFANGWAGAFNHHPYPNLNPPHTSGAIIFLLFNSIIKDGLTDGPMDRQTKPLMESLVRDLKADSSLKWAQAEGVA